MKWCQPVDKIHWVLEKISVLGEIKEVIVGKWMGVLSLRQYWKIILLIDR